MTDTGGAESEEVSRRSKTCSRYILNVLKTQDWVVAHNMLTLTHCTGIETKHCPRPVSHYHSP